MDTARTLRGTCHTPGVYLPTWFDAGPDAARAFVVHSHAGDLVTAGPDGLSSSFVPYVFDQDRNSLLAHLARQNPQGQGVPEGGADALMIVRGPDGYVSPGWYVSKAEHGRVVPTWDYVSAHVHGRLVVHDDPDFVEDVVRRLTVRHESGRLSPWSVDDAPERFVRGQLQAVVGVELVITRIELKRKLSQNRPSADIDGVVAGFRDDLRPDLADLVQEHRPEAT